MRRRYFYAILPLIAILHLLGCQVVEDTAECGFDTACTAGKYAESVSDKLQEFCDPAKPLPRGMSARPAGCTYKANERPVPTKK